MFLALLGINHHESARNGGFSYGGVCVDAKIETIFDQIFRYVFSYHLQWQSEDKREKQMLLSYRRLQSSSKEEDKQKRQATEKDPIKGGPPPLVIVHLMEDRVPLCCAYIGTKVLVKACTRTTVVAANFECFANFQII